MARVGARPAILPSSRPRLMIEERARFHRVQVPHPRPEPVDGGIDGRKVGARVGSLFQKDRPTLPDKLRRGGWGTRHAFRRLLRLPKNADHRGGIGP